MVAAIVRSVDGDGRAGRGRGVLSSRCTSELGVDGQATGLERVLQSQVPTRVLGGLGQRRQRLLLDGDWSSGSGSAVGRWVDGESERHSFHSRPTALLLLLCPAFDFPNGRSIGLEVGYFELLDAPARKPTKSKREGGGVSFSCVRVPFSSREPPCVTRRDPRATGGEESTEITDLPLSLSSRSPMCFESFLNSLRDLALSLSTMRFWRCQSLQLRFSSLWPCSR